MLLPPSSLPLSPSFPLIHSSSHGGSRFLASRAAVPALNGPVGAFQRLWSGFLLKKELDYLNQPSEVWLDAQCLRLEVANINWRKTG